MAAPSVYGAINAITAEIATCGIPKRRFNEAGDYSYRSIDDVLNALAPLLAKHRLCVLPAAISRETAERASETGELLIATTLRVRFTLVSVEDGSKHIVETYGEALDGGDKATAKAMSAAYKCAMIQTFCIPVGQAEDADAASHKLSSRPHAPEPVQGWDQWACDIMDILTACETEQAIDTVQQRNRELLVALSRERAELYAELGRSFGAHRERIRGPGKGKSRNDRTRVSKRAPQVTGDVASV